MYLGKPKQTRVVLCAACGEAFNKPEKEVARQLRAGRSIDSFLCGFGCVGTSRKTENAPFAFYVKRARANAKSRNYECSITKEHLIELWHAQQGRCAYTHLPLRLVRRDDGNADPCTASLDRIDSSRGYVEGNVEFVSLFVNLGKNKFSKEAVVSFLENFKTQ